MSMQMECRGCRVVQVVDWLIVLLPQFAIEVLLLLLLFHEKA